MEIMKCPHKHQKHYAKVSFDKFNNYRVCAITVTTSMVEMQWLMRAHTPIGWYTQKASARIATSTIITSLKGG